MSFKDSFKYYKSKNPPPNLDKIIDFDKVDEISVGIKQRNLDHDGNDFQKYGLRSPKSWTVYELLDHPGLIFIKNPFLSVGQRYWVVRCLRDYSRKPNKSNLDALNLVPDGKEWWEFCQNNNSALQVNKLRWVTLGYHHNWDTKVYSEDDKGEFPDDLADLSHYIAAVLNFSHFKAEAAIVNFYHMDSTLSGHSDYSEQNLEAPLISISLGQTAIFLVGGKDKDEEPNALFLRSGDIVIMSEESRLCYHGVPKILQMDSRFWNYFREDEHIDKKFKNVIDICKDEALWKPFSNSLNNCRININIRQVLKQGQKRLCSQSEEKT